ncbi:ExbD/TolR family protein [Hymenobacter pini]|uniref:ExbD/TolR family protein n=1 Tax=Hymenobacter pini TaxID=2880879 RepID=UPI001CF29A60|nr:biopolymer transporter ExbD [Hymenobacter pini]MCA8832184.1 biopolymer transporter ExbD [Hymenobacter pini]
MAEIQQQADSGKGGKKRAKKMSTKIDMTPMVDLAFLLLTFFMLTTTFSKPTVMEVAMPVKPKPNDPEPPAIKESNALTVLLGENNKVYYYDGLLSASQKPELKLSNYSADGIRKVLLQRNRNPQLVVLIKPVDKSNYKNMVDILDEMNITNTKKYALVNITKPDEELIQSSGL